MCGFYRSQYVVDGVKKTMATTQFEACDARRAFPCWDEPACKATFAFTLTVPEHMTAVSNMPVKATVHFTKAKTKTVAFETTVKMSTYLGAFVVGGRFYSPCLMFVKEKSEVHESFPPPFL